MVGQGVEFTPISSFGRNAGCQSWCDMGIARSDSRKRHLPQTNATAKRRFRNVAVLVAICPLLGLTGCGSISGKVGETIADNPTIGLPAGVPERPTTPMAYPAVHDMPPARPATLTAAEQMKMEDDLNAARTQQQTLIVQPSAPAAPPPPAAAPAKPPPAKKAANAAKKKSPPAAAAPSPSTRGVY